MIADLVDDVSAHALGKDGRILTTRNGSSSGRARFIVLRLACARQDFDEIRRKGKTCPPLAARQYPFIAIPHRLRLYAGEVRAGGRFGKRDVPIHLPCADRFISSNRLSSLSVLRASNP